MIERKDVASWLEGPGGRRPQGDQEYAGQRLGRPGQGPGSLAGFPRRLGAVTIDWIACVLIARAFSPDAWVPLLVFYVENLVLVSTLGSTFGMRLLRLQVVRTRPEQAAGPVSPWRVALRTLLLCALIPATVWDRDGRGLHDKAADTVVVNRR